MTPAESFALAAVACWLAILTVVVVLLTRQLALLHDRVTRLSSAPLASPDTPLVVDPTWNSMLRREEGAAVVLLFLSHTCSGCAEAARAVAALPTEILNNVVAVCDGDPARSALELESLMAKGVDVIVAEPASDLFQALKVEQVPLALHVRNQRVVDRTQVGIVPQVLASFIVQAVFPVYEKRVAGAST